MSNGSTVEPRAFRTSLWRRSWLPLAGLGFLLVGLLMVEDVTIGGWLSVGFGAVCTAVGLFIAVRPNRLEISAEGFTTVTLGRQTQVAWRQCSPFRVGSAGEGVGPLVIFDCEVHVGRGGRWSRRANSRLVGANCSFPETYGLAADELAALLNRYRDSALDP